MSKKYKNTVLPGVTIEGTASDGKCVARWNGQVVFVEGVAPGDVADIRIIRKKKTYLEGVPEKFLHKSEIRTSPFCDHFGVCGGCKWQHIEYQHQVEFKRQQVIDNLQRIGKVAFPEVRPIVLSPETRYFRNKLEFTFSNRRWLSHEEISTGKQLNRMGVGFHKLRQFDKIIDIDHCYLQGDPSNEIRNSIRNYAKMHDLGFYDILQKQGFLRNLIIRTTSTGEIMVVLQVGQDQPELTELLQFIDQSFPQLTSLQYVINNKGNETFFDLPVRLFSGSEFITEKMGTLEFRIGAKSFYQTNSLQAHEMYKLIKQLATLSGIETVYDLYTGAGTIALFIAAEARNVVGLELVPEAIQDAGRNAEINGINNTYFYAGDIKDTFGADIIDRHGAPDVVIADPPRSGMHPAVVEQLIKFAPKNIIYVSCNPATQARDVGLLSDHYGIVSVHPIDMFPQTHHVECVIHLQIK
jgi:23S rRNA (uracil1939-C5)-methyltransferase